jgi:hypothetical protein
VSIAQSQNDLENTQEALADDKKFLADLSKNCADKTADWETRSATRAEELVAIAETIKVLNSDDALELFKKTLPSAALIQFEATADKLKKKAIAVLQKFSSEHPKVKAQVDFVTLALKGKKGFDKVLKMIDNLVELLKKEQTEDDNKKDYCGVQLDEAEDKKKGLDQKIADHETSMEDAEGKLAAAKDDIKSLGEAIKALDKSVADATEQRKNENAEYKELIANDSQAKDVLAWAKNRLNKFYNPKLYKPAPKRELEDAFIAQSEAPPPPPETYGAYSKKEQESGGVIAMIDLLVRDLDKEMTEAGVEEKNAQAEYEKTMADAADKRAQDVSTLAGKEQLKATLEGSIVADNEGKTAASKELMATVQYMGDLHNECDWLLKNFQVRKEARASEIDALGNAKAVLNGADFSLVQLH